MTPVTAFDPTRPSYIDDPYPALARLRRRQPVYWWPEFNAWLVTSHDASMAVLGDAAIFTADPVHIQGPDELRAEEHRRRQELLRGANRLVGTDDPDHRRLRDVVAKAFSYRSVDDLRPVIEAEVVRLLEPWRPSETFDLVAAVAKPLPLRIIAEQLGVAEADRPTVIEGARRVLSALNPLAPSSTLDTGKRAVAGLDRYLTRLAADEVELVGGEVLARMVEAEQHGQLTRHELLALTVDLATAGNQALEMAIANSVYSLLDNRDQLDVLRDDPTRISDAIDELLRYETPTQALPWFAAVDTELAGRSIAAGQKVFVMAGAANRDPAVFDRPDELDVQRSARRQLAFGAGVHACLGAALARHELEVVLDALVRGYDDLRLRTRKIAWDSGFMHRGVKDLPMALSRR